MLHGAQEIYPYFIITSVSRSITSVDIETVQLHSLIDVEDYLVFLGDVTLNGTVDVNDIILVIAHVLGETTLIGEQLIQADLTEDGVVDVNDIIALIEFILSRLPEES